MKIYIAGKISGLVYEDALRAFAEAALEIERCGHTAVNPMAEVATPDLPWVEYMEKDIPLLLSCDAIYLLPNWKQSNGARIEKAIAEASKMIILTHGFRGRRGEIFPVCKDCGFVLEESDTSAGIYHCGECKRKSLGSLPANNANGRESEEVFNAEAAKDAESKHLGITELSDPRDLSVKNELRPEEWIECQADHCGEKFIQTDPDAEVDLCPPCDAALMRATAQV
jgi:predicted Zn-ribbon and HTH transcriptional regulator